MLNGLLKPTSGTVLLDGEDIFEEPDVRSKKKRREARAKKMLSVRQRVGLVFQYPEHQLFEETVYKDIGFGPKNMGLGKEEIDERVREAASFVGVEPELFEKSPLELSGGQKRRIAIAGVIAMRPGVLILDEPTAGLDPAGCREILENIRDYHKQSGTSILMVSHSMEEVARYADRILVLANKTVAMDGTPQEVFAHAAELETMGLAVPQVTDIALRLEKLGVRLPPVYTVEQAADAILALKGGEADA
jgi:energy-coupling factor transport system ATP-binding protein